VDPDVGDRDRHTGVAVQLVLATGDHPQFGRRAAERAVRRREHLHRRDDGAAAELHAAVVGQVDGPRVGLDRGPLAADDLHIGGGGTRCGQQREENHEESSHDSRW
jgi:hypothetical protein